MYGLIEVRLQLEIEFFLIKIRIFKHMPPISFAFKSFKWAQWEIIVQFPENMKTIQSYY